jgi:ACS family hexuronate transporter-like MFS transporter
VPLIFVVAAPNPLVAVLIIGLGTAGHQAFSSNIFAMITDLYPRRAVATVAGMGGLAGSIGGILIAQATGWALELTGSYVWIVAYAGLAYLLALAVIHTLVPQMEPAPMAPTEDRR